MNKYLLNSVDVNLSLKNNNRSFLLMYDNDQDLFNVQIEATYLKVRRVVVSPSIMLTHAMALEKANAKASGAFKLNPLNFEHFCMVSISVKIASQNVPFSTPLEFKPNALGHDIIEG